MNKRLGLVLVSSAFCVVFGLTGMTFSPEGLSEREYWLVTTRHPHEVEEVLQETKTYYEKGRHWVVTIPGGKAPSERVLPYLRSIKLGDLKQFRPPRGKKARGNAQIKKVIAQASKATYQSWVEYLVSFQNRGIDDLDSVANSGNIQSTYWLRDEFHALGYESSLHCYKNWQKDSECNVVAKKPGTDKADEIILVEGHFDDVGHHQAGADDNASGAIALLEMARVIKDYDASRTIIFLATNGEEEGLRGSRAYVKAAGSSISDIKFVINMDMIGYNSDGIVDIETNNAFEAEARWYATQLSIYTPLSANIMMPAWGSDHVPFLEKNIPTILTIEHWDTKTPCYHKSCDKVSTLNFDYALEIIRLNLAVLIQKAEVRI